MAPQQFGQVAHDDIGAVGPQSLGLANPIDADDEAEVARSARLDTHQRILEHGRLSGIYAQRSCAREKGVRGGLAGQVLALSDDPVDDLLEEILDARSRKHVAAVGARGDDGAAQSRLSDGCHVANRALVRLDAVLVDQPEHDLVLAIAKSVDRVRRLAGHPGRPPEARSRARPGTTARRRSEASRRRIGRSRGSGSKGTNRSPVRSARPRR